MSEREVREAAQRMLTEGTTTIWSSEWEEGDSPQGQLHTALSEPPDVVVLLRQIREEQDETLHSTSWTEEHRTGLLNAFAVVVDYILEQFHVRLTDDGWEWVEEGECTTAG